MTRNEEDAILIIPNQFKFLWGMKGEATVKK